MSPSLPSDLQQFVNHQIASGTYRNVDDLMLDAVRRLRDSDEQYQKFRTEMRRRIAAIERGEGIVLEGDEALEKFFDEIEAEVEQELAEENGDA